MLNKINQEKKSLRQHFTKVRSSLSASQRETYGERIFQKTIALEAYQNIEGLLTYVSMKDEVDTKQIIQYALNNKKVYVPLCVDGNQLSFYKINVLSELTEGKFGVLEPNPKKQKPLLSFQKAICIVPGRAFDLDGYRLGYGGGYYDRFLQSFTGITIGYCYSECISDTSLPKDTYDKAVDIVITQDDIYKIQKEEGLHYVR